MNRKQTIQTGIIAGLLISIGVLQYRLYKRTRSKSSEIPSEKPLAAVEPLAETALVSKEQNPPKETKAAIPVKKETGKTLGNVEEKTSSIFPLQLGSCGEQVTQLQMYLVKNHGWASVTMGTFDTATQKRALQFLKTTQIDKNLYDTLIDKPVQLQ